MIGLFAHGDPNARTAPACHGVAFFNGTPVDGRGLTEMLHFAAKTLSGIVKIGHSLAMPFKSEQRRMEWKEKYRIHGKKKILMDASEHRISGTTDIKGLIIPASADNHCQIEKRICQCCNGRTFLGSSYFTDPIGSSRKYRNLERLQE